MSASRVHPDLVMAGSEELNGKLSHWRIHSEPQGVPFSFDITGEGWSVNGPASSVMDALRRISNYYDHMTTGTASGQ